MNDRLSYSIRRKNNITILDLSGKIIGSWSFMLKDELHRLKEAGVSTVILNFQGVTSIDSLGVMAITVALEEGLIIKVVHLNTTCREILEQSRVANLIPIFATEEEALGDVAVPKLKEKRKYTRINTNIPVEIFLANHSRRGVLLNISEGGALVGYLDPLNVESYTINNINIKMKLPFLGSIELEGKPVRFSRSSEMHVIGVQLFSTEKGKKLVKEVFREKPSTQNPPSI